MYPATVYTSSTGASCFMVKSFETLEVRTAVLNSGQRYEFRTSSLTALSFLLLLQRALLILRSWLTTREVSATTTRLEATTGSSLSTSSSPSLKCWLSHQTPSESLSSTSVWLQLHFSLFRRFGKHSRNLHCMTIDNHVVIKDTILDDN